MPTIYPTFVPNDGPFNASLWLVGESPGEDEVAKLTPFIGKSGELLTHAINAAGVQRQDVRLCNLSNYRPYGNDFELLKNTTTLADCLRQLEIEIRDNQPNLIIALGAEPLEFLTGKKGITRYRGSLLKCSLPGCSDIKVLPTFHPSNVLREPGNYPAFSADINKAVSFSTDRNFPDEPLNIHINPRGNELVEWEDRLLSNPTFLASDIESTMDASEIICVGYAVDRNTAVVLSTDIGENLRVIERVNASREVSKTYHFGTYDRLVLRSFGLPVTRCDFDTYQAARILNPELPAGLDFLTSTYTNIPYYKQEGRGELPSDSKVWSSRADKKSVYVYNAKDCIATYQIQLEQSVELEERGLFGLIEQCMNQMEMAVDMALTGLPIDVEKKALFETALLYEWSRMQLALDALCMRFFGTSTSVNVRSTKIIPDLLYSKMKFKPRKNKGAKGPATDENALASMIALCEGEIETAKKEETKQMWRIKAAVLQGIIDIREKRQLLATYIRAGVHPDNRMRGIFVVNGTETGRWSGKKYVDDTGVNAQTFPRGTVSLPDEVLDGQVKFDAASYLKQLSKEDEESEEADLEGAAS